MKSLNTLFSPFNLTCRIPNETDLKAYLFQITEEDLGLSDTLRKDLDVITQDLEKFDLNKLSIDTINEVLLKNNVFPNKIYFFQNQFEIKKIAQEATDSELLTYENYPTLFTKIHGLSFDDGGLVVLEFFNSQIYRLFSSTGNGLTDYCQDLELITYGRFVSRTHSTSLGFEINQYDSKNQNFHTVGGFGNWDPYPFSFLPLLNSRDRIYEMYYPNKDLWEEMNSFHLNSSKEELREILNNDKYWLTSRELLSRYTNDEELALIVLNKQPEAFNLLSESLQNDKRFVIKALSNKCNIYNYINEEFRNDKDIIIVGLKETTLEGEVLIYLPEMVKEDMALLMLAISKSTYSGIFEFVPKKFKNSKEFILKSLRLNGLWLNFLSDNFKDDKEVVLIAVNNRADALNFVSDRLKIDSDVLQTAKKSLTLKITLDADELPF